MGIPAETATSESGSGQFEVTLTHSSAIESADNTWLFKMLTKGLAQKHKMVATFMAKPFHDDAGTGMHMHFSVTDQDGANVFNDGGDLGSDVLRHAVGGCLATMAEATMSAADAAMNTVYLLTSLSAANSMVANWVLSPSSAIKTVAKMVMNTFQSMRSDQLEIQSD